MYLSSFVIVPGPLGYTYLDMSGRASPSESHSPRSLTLPSPGLRIVNTPSSSPIRNDASSTPPQVPATSTPAVPPDNTEPKSGISDIITIEDTTAPVSPSTSPSLAMSEAGSPTATPPPSPVLCPHLGPSVSLHRLKRSTTTLPSTAEPAPKMSCKDKQPVSLQPVVLLERLSPDKVTEVSGGANVPKVSTPPPSSSESLPTRSPPVVTPVRPSDPRTRPVPVPSPTSLVPDTRPDLPVAGPSAPVPEKSDLSILFSFAIVPENYPHSKFSSDQVSHLASQIAEQSIMVNKVQ